MKGSPAISTAVVEITDKNGAVISLNVNAVGNFYRKVSEGAVALPYTAKIKYDGRERAMGTAQMSGDCNSCHTQAGANDAPGRVLLLDLAGSARHRRTRRGWDANATQTREKRHEAPLEPLDRLGGLLQFPAPRPHPLAHRPRPLCRVPGSTVTRGRHGEERHYGKRKLLAQNVSHSNIKTKRWQNINIQTRRVWVLELSRFVTLRLTTRDIRTIDKVGVTAYAKRYGVSL